MPIRISLNCRLLQGYVALSYFCTGFLLAVFIESDCRIKTGRNYSKIISIRNRRKVFKSHNWSEVDFHERSDCELLAKFLWWSFIKFACYKRNMNECKHYTRFLARPQSTFILRVSGMIGFPRKLLPLLNHINLLHHHNLFLPSFLAATAAE